MGAAALGWLFATPFRPHSSDGSEFENLLRQAQGHLKLEILVAAYNEAQIVTQTLESIELSARRLITSLGEQHNLVEIQITVGLDHCTDETAAQVSAFASGSRLQIRSVENLGESGKWNTVQMLIQQSQADWVALVDCGSVWNVQLLQAAWPALWDANVLGVAPSYAPKKSGLLERLNWKLERTLKKMENSMRGPVSVHGATVLYRRNPLLRALLSLHGTHWLNDDVVVPLTLRMQNPDQRLFYLSEGVAEAWVTDVGVSAQLDVEYRRRKRMVAGNLQWIRQIFLPQLQIALVASRRFFRVFWAYWISLIFLGMGAEIALALQSAVGADGIASVLLLELLLLSGVLLFVAGILFSNWVRRLCVAFISGLLVTRYWNELRLKRGISWI